MGIVEECNFFSMKQSKIMSDILIFLLGTKLWMQWSGKYIVIRSSFLFLKLAVEDRLNRSNTAWVALLELSTLGRPTSLDEANFIWGSYNHPMEIGSPNTTQIANKEDGFGF
ncbi:hypothetical protein FH972_010384 [Carpinus fangiana]|uniref:Uncharacterized protein n=1 Tax=Carpinus fangiana TaxID=176857 RepID=A0A660KU80_9ROSI|nr:hypothetical protein FH972_010384 [Carpinus fangiana]